MLGALAPFLAPAPGKSEGQFQRERTNCVLSNVAQVLFDLQQSSGSAAEHSAAEATDKGKIEAVIILSRLYVNTLLLSLLLPTLTGQRAYT